MFARVLRPLRPTLGCTQLGLQRPLAFARPPTQGLARSFSAIPKRPVSVLAIVRTSGLFASATTATLGAGLWRKPIVHCQGAPPPPAFDIDVDTEPVAVRQRSPLIKKGELSFGLVMGLCTGFLIKKVGKLFALMVGLGFVFLQYMSFNGYITVNWDRIEGRYNDGMGAGKDGRVTFKHVQKKWNSLVGFLTHNIQFKSTFLAGLYGGIRYG
ncbi:FUN14 family-domain-containing protein [Gongronella butleri]|nr:FUN14 family-domain-containing protein [Gongronella butleri]